MGVYTGRCILNCSDKVRFHAKLFVLRGLALMGRHLLPMPFGGDLVSYKNARARRTANAEETNLLTMRRHCLLALPTPVFRGSSFQHCMGGHVVLLVFVNLTRLQRAFQLCSRRLCGIRRRYLPERRLWSLVHGGRRKWFRYNSRRRRTGRFL